MRATIVTGYLGAGKSRAAAALAAPGAALIADELGEPPAGRPGSADDLVVETTGLTHPAEAVASLPQGAELDAVVCCVDAKHAVFHLDDSAVCRAQIAAAGAILVTKADLVAEPDTKRLERRLAAMNPNARIVRDPAETQGAGHAPLSPGESGEPGVEHVPIERDGELDPAAFHDWLDRLLLEHGPDLFRLKGTVALTSGAVALDVVHMTAELTPQPGGGAGTRLSAAGRRLDQLFTSLRAR